MFSCRHQDAIPMINRSSSPVHDGLSPQHTVHAHPVLHVLLFTALLSQSYIPDVLSNASIVLKVKNRNKDISKITNSRPTSLTTIVFY